MVTTRAAAPPRHAPTGERGASLVEFALFLPFVAMLAFAMLTGGLAYSRNLDLTHASREAVRFGATLGEPGTNAWLQEVFNAAVSNADGELSDSVDGRYVCVAYVDDSGVGNRWAQTGPGSGSASSGSCFSDSLAGENRVQVQVERASDFDAILFDRTLTLRSQNAALYEVSD